MKMPLHPEAVEELLEAVDWYERQEPSLGGDFLDEVEAAAAVVLDAPERWPVLDEETGARGYLLPRFPYRLFYRQGSSGWTIIAVYHGHRRPGAWRGRR